MPVPARSAAIAATLAYPGGWRALPALFLLPCRLDRRTPWRVPLVTWALAAGIGCVGLLSLQSGVQATAVGAGLIPNDLLRNAGMTWLTSFFVHGGVVHVLVNLYFLLSFGASVEDLIGRARFALLVLVCTLTGNAGHVIFDPRGDLPLVGASGGVSGILACYALCSPRATLGYLVPNGWLRLRWKQVSAAVAFLIWVLLQVLGAYLQLVGSSPESSFAHLGGAAGGWLMWFMTRA